VINLPLPPDKIVNAHTHLELGGFARLCPSPEGEDFVPWILKLIDARRAQTADGPALIRANIEAGIASLRACGTTHVGDISATGESVEPLLASGLGGVVYYEILGLNRDEVMARLLEARKRIEAWRRCEGAVHIGLSLHAPYSCHPDVFREGARWCLAEDVPMCIHVAESQAEGEMLMLGTGDFIDFQRTLSLPSLRIPGLSPIAYLEDLGVLAAKPLLVHCVEVDDYDIVRIARSGASVVHCPRSNRRLRCGRMPLEKYLAAGVPVALGTDSLASSPSLNVREEVEEAIELHAGYVRAEAVQELLTREFPVVRRKA
jgi:cytosine/adenosine deaminase-related metal-dependent hydrolase